MPKMRPSGSCHSLPPYMRAVSKTGSRLRDSATRNAAAFGSGTSKNSGRPVALAASASNRRSAVAGSVREQGTDLDAAPAGPCDAISLRSAVIHHTQRNVGFRSEPGAQEVRPYATEMRPVVEGDGGRVFRPEIRDAGSGSRRRDIFATVEADLAMAPLPSSLVADGFEKLGPQHGLSRIGDYQLKL